MKDLIEALQIFLKYADEEWPTNCSHDELTIMGVDKKDVSDADVDRLEELGFNWSDEDDGYFYSFKFGSA